MKKKLIITTCIVLIISICLGFASCSSNKYKDKVVDNPNSESQQADTNEGDVTNADGEVVDNGNTNNGEKEELTINQPNMPQKNGSNGYSHVVTKKSDKNDKKNNDTEEETKPTVQGNKVEFAEDTTKAVNTTIPQKQKTTAASNSTTKKADDKSTTKKADKDEKTTTGPTTTTSPMTTTDPSGPIVLPEVSLDPEYALTPSGAMFLLQEKYDKKKYVVNCHEATDDEAILTVYTLKNAQVYSTAKVNLKNGKTVEKFTDKKKDKKEYVLEF